MEPSYKLKQKICGGIAKEQPEYELLMTPYIAEQEDLALENILESIHSIRDCIPSLQDENSIIYSYAYMQQMYPEAISTIDSQALLQSICNHSEKILENWEIIHLSLQNHTTRIILATLYLKLCRMQQRLLTEPWTEDLHQQVIQTRELYIQTIGNSHYID